MNTAQKQRNVLWELVIAALRSKLPFAKVKDLLARALEQFIAAVVPSEYCPKLLDHATTLYNLVNLSPISTDPAVEKNLKTAKESIDDESSLCNLMKKFPVHGTPFIAALEDRLSDFGKFHEWVKGIRIVQKQYKECLTSEEVVKDQIEHLKGLFSSLDMKGLFGKAFANDEQFHEFVKIENAAYTHVVKQCVHPLLSITRDVFTTKQQFDPLDLTSLQSGVQDRSLRNCFQDYSGTRSCQWNPGFGALQPIYEPSTRRVKSLILLAYGPCQCAFRFLFKHFP